MTEQVARGGSTTNVPAEVDAVVVGAGFGGMYMLHRLRGLGMSTVVFEGAPDVGGTWYWNAYPGARCDIESVMYNYSFDPVLREEYQTKWTQRYAPQAEILEYARHVAERYDLRRDICFGTRVLRAQWDDDALQWLVETDAAYTVRARYLISAVGCLSTAALPDIPGLDSFGGKWYHTGRWPHDPVDMIGKRVVQIGTGSSGIQIAPVIAAEADHLTVLQRTAQYTIPARNAPLTAEKIQESLDRIQAMTRIAEGRNVVIRPLWEGFNSKATSEDSPAKREAYLERLWETGGPYGAWPYTDTLTDRAANEIAAEFVRGKIRSIVTDPETAQKLTPTYLLGTKRPAIDTDYYQTFNRSNVSLEDIRANPIDRIVSEGVLLRNGTLIQADIIVFATGFDALTGPILGLGLVGLNGQTIRDAWALGPRTYLGIASNGFPNCFLLTGPGSPSVLSNVIYSLEQHINWLTNLLGYIEDHGIRRIEAKVDYQDRWAEHCNDLANKTLFPQTESWYVGANIPGKPRVFLPYVAGNALYQREIDKVAASGYKGFELSGTRDRQPFTANL